MSFFYSSLAMEELSWDSDSPVAIRTTNFPLRQKKRRVDEYDDKRQHNVSSLVRIQC